MSNATLDNMGRELDKIRTASTYDRHRFAVADAHAFILAWSVGYYEKSGAVPVDVLTECMDAVRDASREWARRQRVAGL